MDATATFIGGPLDGQTTQRAGAQWSLYRDDDGSPISTKAGDAEWCRRRQLGKGEARRYYVRQFKGAAVTYLHATAWR